MTVLSDRDPTWLPALLPLVAEQLRYDEWVLWTYYFVEALRVHLDATSPTSAAYVTGWVLRGGRDAGGLLPLIRAEPRFASLLPLVMEIDDLAARLSGNDGWPGLISEVIEAIDSGMTSRDDVLDALLGRLQRGGRPQPTIDFSAIHDAIDPTPSEVLPRVRDYLVLLPPGSARSVAGVAQRALFALHDDGLLPVELLAEASYAVLGRPEKNLVRAQLTRLREHARQSPDDIAVVAVATTAAFGNAAPDLQRGAIELIATWTPHIPDDIAATLITRGTDLPNHLADDLATALGRAGDGYRNTPLDMLPVVLTATPAAAIPVGPIESAAEAVEQLLLLLYVSLWL